MMVIWYVVRSGTSFFLRLPVFTVYSHRASQISFRKDHTKRDENWL